MKVSREQVADNRIRILEAAARLFRERGTDRVTVAEIMKAAGLTHGGFYGYFASKEDLVAQALGYAAPSAEYVHDIGTPAGRAAYIDNYLSAHHRDAPGGGCFFATLGPEVARQDETARHALTERFQTYLAKASSAASGAEAAARRKAATADLAAMIGAMVLARAVDEPALSDDILGAVRETLKTERAEARP
jgi:TetR/AcrR family transcriptional repressor of nem operon